MLVLELAAVAAAATVRLECAVGQNSPKTWILTVDENAKTVRRVVPEGDIDETSPATFSDDKIVVHIDGRKPGSYFEIDRYSLRFTRRSELPNMPPFLIFGTCKRLPLKRAI